MEARDREEDGVTGCLRIEGENGNSSRLDVRFIAQHRGEPCLAWVCNELLLGA